MFNFEGVNSSTMTSTYNNSYSCEQAAAEARVTFKRVAKWQGHSYLIKVKTLCTAATAAKEK